LGDDRFGLWAEFTIEPEGGEPVVQRMRWIEPGTFRMGSPKTETRGLARDHDERNWFEREHPRHAVTLTQGYWLANTPCTQVLWQAVTGQNPSRFQSPDRPVERVTWIAIQKFLRALEARLHGCRADLPTEAAWEYAWRAGTEAALYTGPIKILGMNNAPALV
jgi:formylglycine-generating enzyme required for sulfatase activity